MTKSDDDACKVSVTMSTYFFLGLEQRASLDTLGQSLVDPICTLVGLQHGNQTLVNVQTMLPQRTIRRRLGPTLLLSHALRHEQYWQVEFRHPQTEMKDVGRVLSRGNLIPNLATTHLSPDIKELEWRCGTTATFGPQRYLGFHLGFFCTAAWKVDNAGARVCITNQDSRSRSADI